MSLIYLVDDDPNICDTLKESLENNEREVRTYQTAESMLKVLPKTTPDVVISDYHLPGMDGLELVREIHRDSPEIEVIMITGVGGHDVAVAAMQAGAYDYIRKPVNIEELRVLVDKATEAKRLGDKLTYLYDQQKKLFGFGSLIGSSAPMQRVFQVIRMVSESPDTPVVIYGETGTGKELTARAIHENSQRSHEPFVEINCAAIPETLLESELFGYEEGAFTDARKTKRGLIEVAHGGTFFLDEIAGMSMSLQVKLLKALEERKIRRVGGVKDITTDTRTIASTNTPLEKLIEDGKFREDLYYRLNVISIEIPPLRKRGEDVLMLADHFIKKYNEDLKYDVSGLTQEAQEMLMSYNWPGNVRELRNVIERAVLMKKTGDIDQHHLFITPNNLTDINRASFPSAEIAIPDGGVNFEDIEKRYIKAALEKAKGNKSKAATLLGMSRATFRYRYEKFFQE